MAEVEAKVKAKETIVLGLSVRAAQLIRDGLVILRPDDPEDRELQNDIVGELEEQLEQVARGVR